MLYVRVRVCRVSDGRTLHAIFIYVFSLSFVTPPCACSHLQRVGARRVHHQHIDVVMSTDAQPDVSFFTVVGMIAMIVSQLGSWAATFLWPAERAFGFLLPCCAFFWLWALKNRSIGPIRADAGIFSFAPGMLTGLVVSLLPTPIPTALVPFAVAGAALPAFNFVVTVVWFIKFKPGIVARVKETRDCTCDSLQPLTPRLLCSNRDDC